MYDYIKNVKEIYMQILKCIHFIKLLVIKCQYIPETSRGFFKGLNLL